MTPLMQAVRNNQPERVRELIRAGAGVDELDENGDAPIVIAAYEGHTQVLKLLLDAGAALTAVDPGMKATALHAAAYAGRAEAARLLVAHGIDIDRQGPYNGYTALHDAIWQNHVETAQVLIDAGANLALRSHEGQTPLDLARAKQRTEIAALITQKLAAG